MGTPILHLAHAADWSAARRSGSYEISTRGATLAEVGFIHCSSPAQLAAVAEAFYADDPEPLVVLELDGDALEAAGSAVRLEPGAEGVAELFPHVYGPVPVAAVVAVRPAGFDEDGRFVVRD